MRRILPLALLGCTFTLTASASGSAGFEVKFQNAKARVEKTSKQFSYEDSLFSKTIPLNRCNEKVFSELFSDYERYKRKYARYPAALPGPRVIALREDNETTLVSPTSDFGFWLRELQSQVRVLAVKAEVECASKH